MNLTDFIPTADNVITAFVTAFLYWFFNRKKQKADASTVEIENSSKIIDQYKDALNDLPLRYEEKIKHIEEMAKNVEKLFEQRQSLLLQENEYHKKQTALYKKMYDDKVKEFNKYKREHP